MTATVVDVTEAVLGRPEHQFDMETLGAVLAEEVVLVTGASGSVGRALVDTLYAHPPRDLIVTDIDNLDVTRPGKHLAWRSKPTVIFHLAAEKLAPSGEVNPARVADVNITGTRNVLERFGCRVVLASTCKAADPETAYGASKLIAERMVLNARGVVCRFYNIYGSGDDVFGVWAGVPEWDPLPVTPCSRRFITMREAVGLLLVAPGLRSGRYAIRGARSRPMCQVAEAAFPGRPRVKIRPRRGDRLEEPAWGRAESALAVPVWSQLVQIIGPHDGDTP